MLNQSPVAPRMPSLVLPPMDSAANKIRQQQQTSRRHHSPLHPLPALRTALLLAMSALLLLNMAQPGKALPIGPISAPEAAQAEAGNERMYFAALLRDVNGRSSLVPMSTIPFFRLLASSPIVEQQQKKRRDLGGLDRQMLAKKYDRNCFFSPVQCTLQQWNDGNSAADEVLLGGGVRRRR